MKQHTQQVTGCFDYHNNQTCIGLLQNGNGMTWFQMQKECMKEDGRLAWINEMHGVSGIVPSIQPNHNVYQFIFTGMLLANDRTMFQINPNESK